VKEGYKKTDIGVIPYNWSMCTLKDISIGKGDYGIGASATEYIEGNSRYLRITDIGDSGRLLNNDIKGLAEDNYEDYLLEDGDIVFARTGNTTGKSYVYKNKDGQLVYAGFLIKFTMNKDMVKSNFVKYVIQSKRYWDWVNVMSTRSGQPGINSNEYSTFQVQMPPLNEQQKIAEILSNVDSQIDDTDKLIEKTKELKKGLMSRLLTKGIGHIEFKKTEVGEIPVEWEIRKLGEIGEVVMGQSPVGDSYNNEEIGTPLLNGPTEFTEKYPIPKQWTTKPTKICKEDDVLFCVRGSSVGRMNISDNKYCIGRGLAAIREKNGETSTTYLYYILQKFINNILNLSVGSTFPNVGKDDLNGLSCIVPPLEEQKKIANILSSVDSDIEEYKNKKIKLEELKKALMQQLLTGKIRVV